jgi:segregation and condensation protein B
MIEETVTATHETEDLVSISTLLISGVECLLFASAEPLAEADIARAAGCSSEDAAIALRRLQERLVRDGSGLQVVQIAGGWQLSTRAEHAETVGRLLARGTSRLSRAALETLAIIAYRQPITAPEIEAVRGVSADGVLKTLMDRRLISEAGRKQTPGRPMLYHTTDDFLHYFGIKDLSQLPEIDMEMPAPVPAEAITDGKRASEPREPSETDLDGATQELANATNAETSE